MQLLQRRARVISPFRTIMASSVSRDGVLLVSKLDLTLLAQSQTR